MLVNVAKIAKVLTLAPYFLLKMLIMGLLTNFMWLKSSCLGYIS